MTNFFRYALLIAVALLTGCKSEVDKCVESQISGWKAEQNRVKQENEDFYKRYNQSKAKNENTRGFEYALELNLVPAIDSRTKAEVEAEFRLTCLKAAK